MKMLFVLFAGFLLAAGCSESDSPEFEQSRRLVRNLYLAPVMSVYAGQTLTLQGVASRRATWFRSGPTPLCSTCR